MLQPGLGLNLNLCNYSMIKVRDFTLRLSEPEKVLMASIYEVDIIPRYGKLSHRNHQFFDLILKVASIVLVSIYITSYKHDGICMSSFKDFLIVDTVNCYLHDLTYHIECSNVLRIRKSVSRESASKPLSHCNKVWQRNAVYSKFKKTHSIIPGDLLTCRSFFVFL